MVGDIDFIILSTEDYPRAIELLEGNGYTRDYEKPIYPRARHYPKLVHKKKIAAVEIHRELLIKKYRNEFNYNFIKSSVQKIHEVSVLSFKNQLILSSAAYQINDYGFEYKSLTLRNAYDVFLLSKKTTAKKAFKKLNTLRHPLNCFLASCFEVFNKPKTLHYTTSKKIEKYLIQFNKLINDKKLVEQEFKKSIRKRMISRRIEIIFKSFFYKKYRVWLFKRITDKNWRKGKTDSIGVKKTLNQALNFLKV